MPYGGVKTRPFRAAGSFSNLLKAGPVLDGAKGGQKMSFWKADIVSWEQEAEGAFSPCGGLCYK
jgi:hypothetical protein